MKRFFKTILVLAFLFIGLDFAYQKAAPEIEKTFGTRNPLPYLTAKVQQFISPEKIQNDNNAKGHTFESNTATVYLDLSNPTLKQAAIDGINIWNNTGAFNFKMTNDKNNAKIIIKAMNDGQTNAAGLTDTQYNSLTGHLIKATVNLNSYYLLNPSYGYNHGRIVNTVEHELGHAIGLVHKDGISVMYPQGSFYTIQPSDVEDVKKLYQEQ
ncbi:matrixin family metalloprotease [Lactobacillus taiwanensis]|uniref:Helicase n=1 Tax=Lactobacillus taiwanensis TaxID=508451 RepID=A0A256LAX2_9LACO|nr:matrixin family metalloprotease [Lactobacillus taiwanensis]OYR86771.1 helicase [Lactobacillus taiwanensis]OYR89757.1 helicase [Lactobacillus taiwanensis]OYR90573.1 helicase [Lactobacillus taiwanensis]OYR96226.1 helicase [Lactobacillus taiwanensis]